MFKSGTLKRNVVGAVGAFILGVSASINAIANELALVDNHPQIYIVKKGDTLWDISGKFLQKPWNWPKIWHANPDISNPHLIYPGDEIRLGNCDGQPCLTVNRGATRVSADFGPRVRVSELDAAIPAIPLSVISPFLSGTRVVEAQELNSAPYVLMGTQKHVISGAGDRFNARGEFENSDTDSYGIYRSGKVYKDPQTGEFLGVQAIDIGSARLLEHQADVGKLEVTRSTQEVRIEDRLLPTLEQNIDSMFYPSSPDFPVSGEIIDVEGGVSQIGPMNVVLLNKGERDGLVAGHVLQIIQKGEVVRDTVKNQNVKLMDERAGLLMVFNTFEKTSYALVLQTDRPLMTGELVQNIE